MFDQVPTPTILVDIDRLSANIRRMQARCDANGVQLWPHIKTHKTVEIARMQLESGATGLVCAKVGEAEAMLPSGVRSLFIAYSLVDPALGPRLRAVADALDTLIVACTSRAQGEALERLLAGVDLHLPVMMAVDTGLEREGARSIDEAIALADFIRAQPHMRLFGIYTHEGHASRIGPEQIEASAQKVYDRLMEIKGRLGAELQVWPGCSVTAAWMAGQPGIAAVRPGTYVFGDLNLAVTSRAIHWDDLAATVLTTVADRPTPELALLDAGSKTFSGDKTAAGLSGSAFDLREIHVTKVSEEHGCATGADVDQLRVGERIRMVPAHVCPTINLTDEIVIVRGKAVIDRWRVAARGKVQ